MSQKRRLAIQLFGHLRTYNETAPFFRQNIVEANLKDGWDCVDVFIHTWDRTDHSDPVWHNPKGKERGRDCGIKEAEEIQELYAPKKFKIDHQKEGERGRDSMLRVNALREEFERERGIEYDYIIMTRPDILVLNEFRIAKYLAEYDKDPELKRMGLPTDYVFAAHNQFKRMSVSDPRYINEADLLWFGSRECMPEPMFGSPKTVVVDFSLGRDFDIRRPKEQRRKKENFFKKMKRKMKNIFK